MLEFCGSSMEEVIEHRVLGHKYLLLDTALRRELGRVSAALWRATAAAWRAILGRRRRLPPLAATFRVSRQQYWDLQWAMDK